MTDGLTSQLVVCLLMLSIAHVALSAAGLPIPTTTTVSYQPGVHPGEWWQSRIIICATLCSPFTRAAFQNSTVVSVSGNSVTLENDVTFPNQTVVKTSTVQNLETGLSGIPYYLTAANLTAGDHVYNSTSSLSITGTDTSMVLGAERNVTAALRLVPEGNFEVGIFETWDRLTGIMISGFIPFYGVNATLSLTATNAWSPTPDFSLSVFPNSLIIPSNGALYLSEITISSLYGFNGDLTLSAVSNSTEFVATLGSTVVNVSGPVAYDNVTLSSLTVGDYSVNVTATNGSLSHSATIQAIVRPPTVGSFTLTASQDTLKMLPGNSTTVTVSVTSVDNFTGPVYLNVVGGLNDPFAFQAFLSPTQLTMGMNQTESATLTVQTPDLPLSGKSIIEIEAVGGLPQIYRSFNISLAILSPDFTIATSPDRVSVSAGQIANSTILVSGYGVYGNVTFATTVSPSGADCVLSKTRLPIIPGLISGGSSTLSCHGPPGTYTVTVTATLGSLTHSRTVTVAVENAVVKPSTSPGFSLFGLPMIQSYGVIAGIIVVVLALAGIAVYSIRKNQRRP